ncbi:hypothetical protein XELAEV_18027850mg [Xenopus laevis]|uniref:GIY-YIG domain-containing protein n=1 Tax=Xenopus laevis TaxID=8355 RepID=A0A974CYA4_XENLA|nr:hypothetical protein XELAEV_18027850mg [Xenopus laevis]
MKRGDEKSIDMPVFITSYSRQYPQVKKIINKYLPVLYGDESLWKLYNKGTYKCGSNRCVTCESLYVSSVFVSSSTGRAFDVNSYINCNTKFVVYLLNCSKCEIQYVGCITRSLKCRMREHINQITSGSESTVVVSRHFLECGRSDITKLKIQGIEKNEPSVRGGDLTAKLFHREAFWIFTLGTRQPVGLNLKFDITCCV